MSFLLTPIGALSYLAFALLAAVVGRDRRMGFWGFFWASILLTPLLTGFFLLMAQPKESGSPRPKTPKSRRR
jgi:hypothetical protein